MTMIKPAFLSKKTSVTKTEWFFVGLVILITALIASLPLITNYLIYQGSEGFFTGNLGIPIDINSYFAKILQAKDTPGWLIFNQYIVILF